MKKKYVYLGLLILFTVIITLMAAYIYKNETLKNSYSYEKLNKIAANDFEEYMIEHPDTILYISDKNNLDNNKFEKKFIKKIEKLNLLENIVYMDKEEMTDSLIKVLDKNYSYNYDEDKLPFIIVVSDNEVIQKVQVTKNYNVATIINYEVFE